MLYESTASFSSYLRLM